MNIPTLSTLSLFLLLLALVLLRLMLRQRARRADAAAWPLAMRRPLASPDQVLYQRLVSALPGYTVLNRVALHEVLGVRPQVDARAWRRRIRHLHYDFVVSTPAAPVLAAIVLDDAAATHPPDQVRARASAAAGIRLLHWQRLALPDPAAIRAALGAQPDPFIEGDAPDTNPSWWPPMPRAGRSPFHP